MLYKKNQQKELSKELFENPSAEYRATPFWAWNDDLCKEELLWQIDALKRMGFGGFHMHTRCGLSTEYLGEEYMDLVRACTEKAKSENMLSWLYDEDRWPSGAAGGLVTNRMKYRQKFLTMTPFKKEGVVAESPYVRDAKNATPKKLTEAATPWAEKGETYLLAVFDVVKDQKGTLVSYELCTPDSDAVGTKWYAYVVLSSESGWYNGQTYVDTLCPEAIREFIRITYEAYKKSVGEEFGKTVPAIFTDEPQFAGKSVLPFADSMQSVNNPWTTDLAETFEKSYGFDIVPLLPELLWELPDRPSVARYRFHNHVCERFGEAFADQCGKWCDENGIYLTGHVNAEDTLDSQTFCVGEAMRHYKGFGIPGIDTLCNRIELSTAKQAQSAAHQYGKEGVLSELYGVTGWDFDFRSHKVQGNWQAALGVTVRVPHLSWYSMRGSAKRDYPASIHYQSSWYEDYSKVENHFARLNTALTRGEPLVSVAVIHPIESCWISYGTVETTKTHRDELGNNFKKVIDDLLYGGVDFDFIRESSVEELWEKTEGATLKIGKMEYRAVVVPTVDTLRSSTVEMLVDFQNKGGKVIFTDLCPKFCDAVPSDVCKELYDKAIKAKSGNSLIRALDTERELRLVYGDGSPVNDYFYQLRRDGKYRWLFIAKGTYPTYVSGRASPDGQSKRMKICISGNSEVLLYDTDSGKIKQVSYTANGKDTRCEFDVYQYDSLLLRLEDIEGERSFKAPACEKKPTAFLPVPNKVSFALSEPNVMVLDFARWSLDGESFEPREEMLRIDSAIRAKYGFPLADGHDVQPWVIGEKKPELEVFLSFEFESELCAPARLACEEIYELYLNGQAVPLREVGTYVDHSIKCYELPDLKCGRNEILAKVPLGKRTSLENMFLIGDFGVEVHGSEAKVVPLPEKLYFEELSRCTLPFYGGGVAYHIPVELEKDCELLVTADGFKATTIRVLLDGEPVGNISYAPYSIRLENVSAGKHTVTLEAMLSRINCFGALHCCSTLAWKGSNIWYTKGFDWAYEYQITPTGITKSPTIQIIE